jgi:hypothetical protein
MIHSSTTVPAPGSAASQVLRYLLNLLLGIPLKTPDPALRASAQSVNGVNRFSIECCCCNEKHRAPEKQRLVFRARDREHPLPFNLFDVTHEAIDRE